uniref:Uncharacterized protein n=1 Tax=Rhizoctonia solani TaxID=456999 RepID=N0ABX6_9AGAM|nr:hypothetical protein RSOL_m01240 [Rhizoctonia solani]AGK45436.1 hypothetical protein RSOL_m01240 [Rhizoctonia solani]
MNLFMLLQGTLSFLTYWPNRSRSDTHIEKTAVFNFIFWDQIQAILFDKFPAPDLTTHHLDRPPKGG